jgi:hypothetical protein
MAEKDPLQAEDITLPSDNAPEEGISNSVDALLSEQGDLPTVPQTPKDEPAPEPVTPPVAPETTAKPEKTEPPAAEPSTTTGNEPPKTADTRQGEKLLAGKYNTTLDLTEAVLEEVRVLKGDKKEIAPMIAEAHKTNDWSKVEAKYKELQTKVETQLSEQKKNEPAKPIEPTVEQPASEAAPAEPDLSPAETQTIMLETAFEDFFAPERDGGFKGLAEDIRALGMEFPKPEDVVASYDEKTHTYPVMVDFLANLKTQSRQLWKEFNDAFNPIIGQKVKGTNEYENARAKAPTFNNSQLEKAKQEISDYGKKFGVEIKPEDIAAVIKDAQAKGNIYQVQAGSLFIKDGAILRYFKSEKADDIIEQVRKLTEAKATTAGRKQAVADIKNQDSKAIRSIGTTSVPGSKPAVSAVVDWNNPESVKAFAKEGETADMIEKMLAD